MNIFGRQDLYIKIQVTFHTFVNDLGFLNWRLK